ncbi:MAG: glycosyltransferase [bacterium]|nr:glycosyltransferase [bacterium]
MTLLTVITVVKDDPSGLDSTLASLGVQEPADIGVVVIDGSSDHEAVPQVLARHSATPVDYSWSAPSGVYGAMNTGLGQADGEYIYFLNAGDVLAGVEVLQRVTSQLAAASPVWAFGRVAFLGSDAELMGEPDWDYDTEFRHWFARGRFPAHQGVVTSRRELLRQGGFDTSYKVAADYASILRCSRTALPLELGLTLAEFTVGGLSTQQWRLAQQEFHRARRAAFDLDGLDSVREQAYTLRSLAAASAYRALWAPGRPAHDLVRRLRAR